MKRITIRIFLIVGFVTISGLIAVQFYLLKTSFNNSRSEFEHSVQVALFQVLSELKNNDTDRLPRQHPVHKKAGNYYVVDVQEDVSCELLEMYLVTEFKRAGITHDFEFAIYDCYSDIMVYGNYISLSESSYNVESNTNFPKIEELVYYFAVHFPNLEKDILSGLNLWFLFAVVFSAMLAFIVFSFWVVLGQKKFSEQQRNFINTVTHEFKTPISANKIALEYLNKSKAINQDTRLKKYIEILSLQNNRLNNFIESLLNIAQSSGHSIHINSSSFNLVDLLEDTINLHKENATVKFMKQIKTKPVIICSDRFHATNILNVLIENAIKYSQPNPEITISMDKTGNTIELKVADNGIGIEKKYRKMIFRQFFRVPTGNVHNVKGFGIGLYYVKLVARKLRWKLQVSENQPTGTIFTLIIPVKRYWANE